MLYVCKSCSQLLKTEEFQWRKNEIKKDGTIPIASICKKCKNLRIKQRDKSQTKREKLKKQIRDFRAMIGCMICGERHTAVLDFHHINPGTKVTQVSSMTARKYSIESIVEEIKKCIVICGNCHNKLHAHKFCLLPNINGAIYEHLSMFFMQDDKKSV